MSTEVLLTGCFNVVHAEHIKLFEFGRRFGRLTVGVNADPYLQKKYGDRAIPLVNRVYLLRHIDFVDEVVAFPEEDPSKLIRKLRPKFFVRGPDYRGIELPEQHALHEVGARLMIRPGDKGLSAGEMVEQLPASVFSTLNVLDF